MSKKRVLAVAAGVGVIIFLGASGDMRRMAGRLFAQTGEHGGRAGGAKEGANRKVDRNQDKPAPKLYVDPRVKQILAPKMSMLSADKFRDYLDLYQKSPRSLAAVYGLTADAEILADLQKHTGSPDALLCLSQASTLSPEERLDYSLQYVQTKPDEMQGYLQAAAMAKRCKKPESEILDLVKKGMAAEKFTIGSDSLSHDMREALLSSGMNQEDAEIHMLVNDHYAGSLLLKGTQMLSMASDIEIGAIEDPAQKNAALMEYLSIARNFKELLPYDNRNGLYHYYSLMEHLLPKFEGEVDLGEGLGSPDDLAKVIKAESSKMSSETREVADCLKQAPPEQVNEYLAKRASLGEPAARTWLIERNQLSF
jgi:hypothetical protein